MKVVSVDDVMYYKVDSLSGGPCCVYFLITKVSDLDYHTVALVEPTFISYPYIVSHQGSICDIWKRSNLTHNKFKFLQNLGTKYGF